MKYFILLNSLFFSLHLLAQNSSNYNYNGTYACPSLSGPGTGICYVDLYVKKGKIKAVEICGQHIDPDQGRTESKSTIFTTDFRENYLYRLRSFLKHPEESSFPGASFKFKSGRLYIYDENNKIVHEYGCCWGGDKSSKDEEDACDCIVEKQSD